MVKPALPTAVLVGLISVSVGVVAGFTVIVNGNVFETVLSGLRTSTFSVPTVVRYVPATVAVNCVLDTNVVGIAVPFQITWLPLTKPVPFAVSVKDAIAL
jgi:ABC-type dipeptide/oligopeptide/nickel transport system permease subunit